MLLGNFMTFRPAIKQRGVECMTKIVLTDSPHNRKIKLLWLLAFYGYLYIMSFPSKLSFFVQVSADFFGRFNAINAMSLLIGTVFMSVIFESLKNLGKPTEETVTSNITSGRWETV